MECHKIYHVKTQHVDNLAMGYDMFTRLSKCFENVYFSSLGSRKTTLDNVLFGLLERNGRKVWQETGHCLLDA